MRPHQKKNEPKSNRPAARVKFAVGGSIVALLVALPPIFGAHPKASAHPAGFLFTVTTLDDHNDFVCDGTDCTFREAIQAANNAPTDDTIDFSVTGTINLLSELPDISDSLTIDGPGSAMLTVQRNSTNEFRIFDVTTTGTVTISGLTISKGQPSVSDGDGGGINNRNQGTVNVTACVVSDNVADAGAGISNASTGTISITDSTISNNVAEIAAGIFNSTGALNVTNSTITANTARRFGGGGIFSNGPVNVTNCTISFNNATSGGGLNVRDTTKITHSKIENNTVESSDGGGIANSGSLTISDSMVIDNSAKRSGGGILNALDATTSITNSTLSGNVATEEIGGALVNQGSLSATNCTFTDNSAPGGGAICNPGGTLNLTNSTVTGNSAVTSHGHPGTGGGIFSNTGTINSKSNIIALNDSTGSGPDVRGAFISAGFNLIGKTDDSAGFTQPTDLTGTIALPIDPGLDPNGLQDNVGPTKTIALVCGSGAIDKGTSEGLTGNLTTDQRGSGFPRTINDPIISNVADGTDIGAFEVQQVCNHPPVAMCRNVQLSAGSNCQATVTVAQIDNGSFDPDPGDSIVIRTLNDSGPFGLGPHNVTLTVTDMHGATGTCMATVTVVDTTPPSITCPANIIIKTANPGSSTIVVNYPPPLASDNCAGVMVVCTPPSGSQFPLGSTTVTCTATDGSMNKATCMFTVTAFDICLQDDASRDTLLFNSQSGDYLFTKWSANGFTLSGRGTPRIQGNIFTLEHYGSDRRVTARLDNGVKKGTASVQYSPLGTTFTITDRNTMDNICACW